MHVLKCVPIYSAVIYINKGSLDTKSSTYDDDHVGVTCLHTGRWRGVFVPGEVFGVDNSKDSV